MRVCRAAMVLSLLAGPAMAQEHGDPAAGRRLAEAQCAECHVIGPGRSGPVVGAIPTFPEVAQRASTTSMSLNAFLRTPHANMPNIVLRPSQMDDVVAYILSLKPGGAGR